MLSTRFRCSILRHRRFRRCSRVGAYQQLCRNLAHDTIEQRIRLVERFLAYTNEFPWTWTPAMVEEFFSDLRSISRRKQSTIRGYQNALRLFCSYVSHPDYGWDRVCEQRFGTHPAQVFFEWNTAAHVQDNEQSPEQSGPSPRRELQDFFDHADDQVALIAASARKGWLPAYRDAVMFKIAYSYGLRFNELRHLQTVDFARNPHAREFGRYGVVQSATARQKWVPAQTSQCADGLRLDAGGDRRLARPRSALHGRRHRPVPQRERSAGCRTHPAAPVPPLLRR